MARLSISLTFAGKIMKGLVIPFLICIVLVACAQPATQKSLVLQRSVTQTDISPKLSFFVTSVGLNGGSGNLGGLAGADAHCEALANRVGQGGKGWKAYLSTTSSTTSSTTEEHGVDARDRIGKGPWFNANGEMIAGDLQQLHGENNVTGETAVTEVGNDIPGRDTENGYRTFHDMLTGTQKDGTASASDGDTTCHNWTSNDEGSALLGHNNREGGGYDATSWVNAHASNGCSAQSMPTGLGLYYCFASSQ